MAEVTHPTPPERPDTSDVRGHNADWRTFNKYRQKKFSGKKVTLPTGINLEASRWANVLPPRTDDTYVLHSPEKLVKNARKDCAYVWRIRNHDETIGLVETQEIRPVRMEEIMRDDRRSAKIIGWAGPGGHMYAGWKRHGLFEVNPQTTYEWYGYPEDEAIAKLARLGPEFESRIDEGMQGKMSGDFSVTNNKKASDEPGGNRPARR
jgi:hypothetical protein